MTQPLSPDLYDEIKGILDCSTKVPVRKRTDIAKQAYKKISKLNLQLKNIHNPLTGLTEKRIVIVGKILAKTTEVSAIVKAFVKETKGAGARRVHHAISRHFWGVSRVAVNEFLQESKDITKLRPVFTNKAPLKPVRSKQPMDRHQIDIVDLQAVETIKDGETFRYVLSVIDVFTRFLWLFPLKNKSSSNVAEHLIKLYLDQQWGAPKILQSDQGGEFKGMVDTLCQRLGVRLIHSQPFHPQSQGKDERSHRVWKDMLRYDLQQMKQVSWVENLPNYCRLHNESLNSSIGSSPYKAMFGFEPNRLTRMLRAGGEEIDKGYICETTEEFEEVQESEYSGDLGLHLEELSQIRKSILSKSDKSSDTMVKKRLSTKPPSLYEIGEAVLVKYHGHGKGVKRGGRKITSPKAKEGIVIKVDKAKHKYRIRIGKTVSWYSVDQVTSLSNKLEKKRKSVGDKETAPSGTEQDTGTKQPKESRDDHRLFTSDSCSSEAEFRRILEILKRFTSAPSADNSMEKLGNMADLRGYEIKENAGGGNCMFLALSDQVYHQHDLPINALELREAVVDQLRDNPKTVDGTHLRHFVTGKKSWSRYLQGMSQSGTWGDNLMLMGAADFLEEEIEVLSTTDPEPIRVKPRKKVRKGVLHLGHLSEHHYVSLERKGEKCRVCKEDLRLCKCCDSLNAVPSEDKMDSSEGMPSDVEFDDDGSPMVTIAFFETHQADLMEHLHDLIQGKFNKDERGKRHLAFLSKYPYQDVLSGFGENFVPPKVYGHILQWMHATFSRSFMKDRRKPYSEGLTFIFTVQDVDKKLRELPMEFTGTVLHYIMYVGVKEAMVFLAQKLTGEDYAAINYKCGLTEMHARDMK